MPWYPVTEVVIDAETVGAESTIAGETPHDADSSAQLNIRRLCTTIQDLQDKGLHVIVVSKQDIREAIEKEALTFLNVEMGHFLCLKSYNPGFIDTIRIAIDYEAFYVTAADLSCLQSDWRFPRKSKEFLLANPGLHVPFHFDSDSFSPNFAEGVQPGKFQAFVEEQESEEQRISPSKTSSRISHSEAWIDGDGGKAVPSSPDNWFRDTALPEIAVCNVQCKGKRHTLLAILGDDKDPLLRQAALLCNSFSISEVEFMRDWEFKVKTPWQQDGNGVLPHVIHNEIRPDGDFLWAIGVSSKKQTRQRAGKLAFFVANKIKTESSTGGADPQEKLARLVDRAKALMCTAMAAGEAVGPTSPLSDSRSAEFLPEKQEDTTVEDTHEIHTHDAYDTHDTHDAPDTREAPKNKMTNSSPMSWLEPVEV